ncbi:hypothetical protein GFJ35_33210 [Burkholderia cenocepacia]|uniref:Uncharacterized protein n=3 Tax=Bacteria TaxID=2 RepID=A0A6B2MPJ2_9BURK|nr:hypothetical protein [Burkholderia cenocepacia]
MRCSSWIFYLCNMALCLFLIGESVQAQSMSPVNQTMQFNYTTNGGADGAINAYGNNSVSVSGDVLRVQIGDSDGDRNINGVGIYEMRLNGKNLEAAKKMAELLCSSKEAGSGTIIPILYIARCGGAVHHGYLSDLGRDIRIKISDLAEELTNMGVQSGRRIVKLDVSLVSIDRAADGFLVSLKFDNSGSYPIQFETPDRWEGKMGKYMDILAVTDSQGRASPKIGFALAGEPLADPTQFAGGKVIIEPHSAVVVKMKTSKVIRFTAGTYDLYAGAFMNIKVVGIESSLLRVDFHSDYTKPTRITFDRDYPSTPQEREQWEAYQRTRLSYFPVKPGQTFKEDGLYRAIRTDSTAHRSLQLVPFKAGDVATTERVKMLMEGGDGISLDGPVEWLWGGSAPTPVKTYSFDTIEETRQFSPSGVPCPRSGRWLPRVREGWNSTRYDPTGIVTLRYGQTMPALKATGDDTDWEWIGV